MSPSPHTLAQQDDELEIVESNEDDVGAALDIRGLNKTGHECTDIWIRTHKTQDVQHIV